MFRTWKAPLPPKTLLFHACIHPTQATDFLCVLSSPTMCICSDALQNARIQVRTFNLKDVKTMRDLNPQDIDQMVAVRGMITRSSGVIPDIKMGFFRCSACGNTVEVMIDRGKIQEPSSCTACQAKASMELVHNRCWFADKQMIKLQEAPENIAEGETPTTVTLYAFDDLVDVGRPGDRVEVTGIFRAVSGEIFDSCCWERCLLERCLLLCLLCLLCLKCR
jgi:DNA replication licensing factor MCM4